ncbi:hypothetical protein ACFWN1_02290 [Streptomyces sp. NPDC058459]|uniref:hypothetical protein n=1 Tax=Streptomyces sp. NPDC058459 TaxID=3346508 RepID=UPI003669EE76
MPTPVTLHDDYQVLPAVGTCGAWNPYEADAAISRMVRAGGEPVTVSALGCELQADWNFPSAKPYSAGNDGQEAGGGQPRPRPRGQGRRGGPKPSLVAR